MAPAPILESCSVGVQKGEPCHKGWDSADIRLIEWRTEISNLKTIILHHVKKYLTRFQSSQQTYCNPFRTHEKAFSSK